MVNYRRNKNIKFFSGKTPKTTRLVIFVILFAGIGTALLLSGFAATITGDGSPSGSTQQRFPGDPNPRITKKAYWGAAIDANGDPVARHELTTGKSLSIRRTYWQWDDHASLTTGKLYQTVKADLAANRLPLISTKTPPWVEVAYGLHDARIDQLLKELNSYGKPVWLVFAHEPENDAASNFGGAASWRAMQQRIRQRMTALGTKNIALMPNLMSYTWEAISGRNPEDWWVPGVWNAYTVDIYHNNTSGHMQSGSSGTQWANFTKWVEGKYLPYGISEWGNRGSDMAAAWEMQAFWDWSFSNNKDMIAYTYFDSGLNSPSGSWRLSGEPLNIFRNILKNDTRVMRINELR